MSDTPRTDAQARDYFGNISPHFARELERENEQMRKAIAAALFSLSGYAPPEFNSASAILQNALAALSPASPAKEGER